MTGNQRKEDLSANEHPIEQACRLKLSEWQSQDKKAGREVASVADYLPYSLQLVEWYLERHEMDYPDERGEFGIIHVTLNLQEFLTRWTSKIMVNQKDKANRAAEDWLMLLRWPDPDDEEMNPDDSLLEEWMIEEKENPEDAAFLVFDLFMSVTSQ